MDKNKDVVYNFYKALIQELKESLRQPTNNPTLVKNNIAISEKIEFYQIMLENIKN